MLLKLIVNFIGLGILIYPSASFAYIGPGLGVGAVAAVLGVLFGLLMLLVGVVWYPLKRLIKWVRAKT